MKHIGLLFSNNAYFTRHAIKQKGYSPLMILKTLLILPYFSLPSIASIYKSKMKGLFRGGKDVFYELKNNNLIDWRKLLYSAIKRSMKIIKEKAEPTPTNLPKAFIVDDTTCGKVGKCIEFIGYVFDHVSHKCILGFKLLTLGYWDGKSFLPVDFSIHGEEGKNPDMPQGMKKSEIKKRFRKKRPVDCPASQRSGEYFKSKIENSVTMIKRAVAQGLTASYVLADSWFIHESFISAIRKIRKGMLHVIGMCATNKNFRIKEQEFSAKALIAKHKSSKKTNRKWRMQYFVLHAIHKGIELKLFFVKTGYGNDDNWKLIISTDLSLSFQKAIEIYQIRWTIEVFFKEAKEHLRLGKSQSNHFNAQIADITISFMQYLLLALLKRFESYETIGGLFRNCRSSLLELTLAERILQIFLEIIRELAELLELDYEMIFEKLLDKKTSTKLNALIIALKNNSHPEIMKPAA